MLKTISGTLALSLIIAASVHQAQAATTYNAVVSKSASDGKTFKTIADAIASAPAGSTPFVILIKNGVYNERLTITRSNLHLKGESRNGAVIAAATAAGTLKSDGSKWGTAGSSTITISAKDFSAQSLTIRNDFDFPANQAKSDSDSSKIKDTQAVALYVNKSGDRAYFKDVSLIGYQDTLYVSGGRSFFSDCRISGTVDFIFGDGTALFDNCDLVSRYRADVKSGGISGYLTAPSTNINQKYGLVITNSRVIRESDSVPAKSYGLGRPWHPTTTFSDGRYADPNAIGQTVFLNTSMDNHIYGWDKMSGKDKDGNTIWFNPEDSRFFEYKSYGAGAVVSKDRRQLTDAQAKEYTQSKVLGDWTPTLP
ncbi:pectinesterase PemA [Dickeya fangzhongdai]|uniref:Pectinesterase n=1 Tax=Dickeya fangzhongdai TaxID=1778540 RepID=A0A2K8QPN5_9GAMM|nr:pectinesterase PemA [Dickeya fangzhongdai]ATZ95436.1 pectinesterase A [Dickeya fangzhongdai]QOH48878.1 pectinesterase A [Dickeya fangzhongdai]QOH53182.1 pectinesterase A [Dickeya fangzhongdai]WOX99614.1 pectinesterase family protein [Dickeya fangzhongdai]WOY05236.1 pectinesterase family protein [Dickeya fangzhongdai]